MSDGDPYIIVEGGLVQNDPALPVFDLDVFESDYINELDIEYVANLKERAAQFEDLAWIVDRCDAFLRKHAPNDTGGDMPRTDHTYEITLLREGDTVQNVCADLLELHDTTGLSLDNWTTARALVEHTFRELAGDTDWKLTENGA